MNEFYRAKFNELFMEFTRYLITHPDFGENIPKGAEIILLDHLDPGYTRYMLEKASKQNAVFIDVGKLAPIRSRMQNCSVARMSLRAKRSNPKAFQEAASSAFMLLAATWSNICNKTMQNPKIISRPPAVVSG